MKTSQQTYLDFLGTPRTQMAIPVFQRVYTWGVWQCEELWEDILRAGSCDESHFIGTIVYTDEEVGQNDSVRGVSGLGLGLSAEELGLEEGEAGRADATAKEPAHCAEEMREYRAEQELSEMAGVERLYNIVDGQQRTTTVFLLLTALRDHLHATGAIVAGRSAEDIEREFLFIDNGERRAQKFIAAPADKDTLAAVLNKTKMPEDYLCSKCVTDNYAFFARSIAQADLEQMWRGLGNLFAIIVELGDDDNPQLVFEGINSKGMSLATRDLLRNRMFFEQDVQTRDRLLQQYWEPLEALFDDDPSQNQFSAALRSWLVGKDESLEKFSRYELYSVFRKYVDEHYPASETEELMQELLAHCREFKELIGSPMVKKHLDWAENHTKIDTGSGFALFG